MGFVAPSGLEPPLQSSPTLKRSPGPFFNGLSRFEPSWAHNVNEPLTICFVGGFIVGARLEPGFWGKRLVGIDTFLLESN